MDTGTLGGLQSRAALLAGAVVLAACRASIPAKTASGSDGEETVAAGGSFRPSNHPFVHEDWRAAKVHALREREGLDRLRSEHADDWSRMLAVLDWVNAQWPPGDPDPYPPPNGADILDAIRAGRTGGFCGQYAYLLADALKALGTFDVRYVELEAPDHRTHFTTEAWSDRWQSWVLLDAYFDAVYLDPSGRPLSALALHEALHAGEAGGVTVEVVAPREYQPPADESLAYYHSFAVSLTNALARATDAPRVGDRLASYLAYDSPHLAGWRPRHAYRLTSARREDFAEPRNQAFVTCRTGRGAAGGWDCALETRGTMVHFDHFLARTDGGPWRRVGPTAHVPAGAETLTVRPVNVAGARGRPVTLRLPGP